MRIRLSEDDLRISDSAGKNLRASGFAVDIAANLPFPGKGSPDLPPTVAHDISSSENALWSQELQHQESSLLHPLPTNRTQHATNQTRLFCEGL